MRAALARVWRWFPATWRLIDEEAAAERAAHPGPDRLAPQVLLLAAVVMTAEWYWGDRPFFYDLFGKAVEGSRTWKRYAELLAFSWWSGAKLVGFLLVPMLHLRLLGLRLRDFGMPLRRAPAPLAGVRWGRIYVVLYLLVLPLLVLVSRTAAFQETYPFYREAGRSVLDGVAWELQYGLTFLSVEFFFRGYLLFGLRRAMGSNAIFVMVVPYCLLHVLKPAAESYAAIVAGVVLGTLALATRSIWCGVLIHVSVAWTMDLLAARWLR